jgi:hypothetical protein
MRLFLSEGFLSWKAPPKRTSQNVLEVIPRRSYAGFGVVKNEVTRKTMMTEYFNPWKGISHHVIPSI